MQVTTNRREAVRKRLNGSGRLAFNAMHVVVQMQDVNITGVCVLAPVAVPANAVCAVEFMLAGSDGQRRVLSVSARVAYSVLSGSQGFRLGMEFVGLPPAAKATIEQYMNG